ncbi:acyl-CoA dehydrogenase family protein [Meiothermus granaticius]|uniref:Acyl-CoA dehydrogenase n=1 Tax=Meiothermus granaticius NBRC 107808 TaxID=1227551 RepID=A0A399FC03_9DEIN|nr:acyl-CoA dehydrogenase family protein [Meiothermus granaticius]MCL6525597.1 acyl-CoA dehydrogenase family protein [Thermaceae bacterium]RIH93703.1 Acyl-CoA dehydrogenase [Meiothermus granaticius NBRC 107808]GEM85773.1 acyl-CoA dehydrogenase [Meiothermus granaticius NBRC 107808]
MVTDQRKELWFELEPEERQIMGALREFLQAEVAPTAQERDERGEFPFGIVKELGQMGVMGAQVPEQYGGAGLSTRSFARIIEEIAAIDGALALTVASHNSLCTGHLLLAGNEAQKQHYLPRLAQGEVLGAWGLTEPGSGSDAAAMRTRAEPTHEGWRLSGSKQFITQGSVGGIYVVNARTDPAPEGKKHLGLSAFIFETPIEGFSVGRKEKKLGLNASDTAQILFEGISLPPEALLGVRGQGFYDVMRVLEGGRIGIAAMAVGLGRAALEFAAKYALEREQFGQPIAEFQGVSFKLAEMATGLEAARLLYLKAADLKDAGRPFGMAAAQAKLLASEVGVRACDEAIQILGGYGYLKDYPVERYWRDARLTRIGEGTSEILKVIIAKNLLAQYR